MYRPLALANKSAIERRSKIAMKTMLLAAVAAVGFGIGPAFAADMQANRGYASPDFWGTEPTHQVPLAKVPTQSNGAIIGTFVTRSSQGTWLFPPNPNAGANS
jgi:hypothetical protein